MKLPRRTFLHLAVGATVLPITSQIARAENPTAPVLEPEPLCKDKGVLFIMVMHVSG
jgi:hypothetical protein